MSFQCIGSSSQPQFPAPGVLRDDPQEHFCFLSDCDFIGRKKNKTKRCRPGIPSCARFVCLKKLGGFFSCTAVVFSKKMTLFFWYDLFGIVLTFVVSKKQKGVVSALLIYGEKKKDKPKIIYSNEPSNHME